MTDERRLTRVDDEASDKEAEERFNASHDPDAPDDEAEEGEEDEEPRSARTPPDWQSAPILGMSDIADAINFPGVLMFCGGRAGTTDIGYELKVRGSAEPVLVAQVSEALGERTYTARFAGKLAGEGAIVRSFRGAADADGNRFLDVVIRLPQTAAKQTGSLMPFLKKGAILALEPEQMTLPLGEAPE